MIKQKYEIGCGLEMLDGMDKDVATLLILDLPYYGVVDADWDNEWKSLDEYLDWCKEWFIKSERVLKSNGSLYYFNSQFKVMSAIDALIESSTALKFRQFVAIDKGVQSVAGRTSEALRTYPNATEYFNFYTFVDSSGLDKIMLDMNNFKPLREYFKKFQVALGISKTEIMNEIGQQADHCFRWGSTQWDLPTLGAYNLICDLPLANDFKTKQYGFIKREYEDLRKEYEDLRKEYEDLRKEYEDLRYPFNSMTGFTDVWRFNFYKDKRHSHPTQKPFDLIERIVLTSSNVGDFVVDPAMGTGTTYKVCKSHDRRFVGRELNPKYEQDIMSHAMPSTPKIESWIS